MLFKYVLLTSIRAASSLIWTLGYGRFEISESENQQHRHLWASLFLFWCSFSIFLQWFPRCFVCALSIFYSCEPTRTIWVSKPARVILATHPLNDTNLHHHHHHHQRHHQSSLLFTNKYNNNKMHVKHSSVFSHPAN